MATFWKWWDRIEGFAGLILLAAGTYFSAGTYFNWNPPPTQRKDYILVGGGPVTLPWLPIALGIIGILILLTSWVRIFRQREKKPTHTTMPVGDKSVKWVKEIFITSDGKTASLSTEYAETGARLRMFVDYSSYVRAITVVGWSKRIRIPLHEARDFVKGQRIVFPLISRGDRPGQESALCWGLPNVEEGVLKHPVGSDKYAARIAFIGDDGSEQYFPFFVVRRYGQDGHQNVVVIQGDDLTIFQRWLAEA